MLGKWYNYVTNQLFYIGNLAEDLYYRKVQRDFNLILSWIYLRLG